MSLQPLALATFHTLALIIVGGGTAVGQEWARFRGADGQGRAARVALADDLELKDARWTVELQGSGHSSPILWGDAVYVTSDDAEKKRRYVTCFAAADGARKWTHAMAYEPHGQHRLNSFASATPAADAHGVYIAWTTGTILQVLGLTHAGKPIWQTGVGVHRAQHGSGASPIAVDGVVIVPNDNESETSFLVGLDAKSGMTLWKRARETSRAAYSTPATFKTERGTEVIFTSTSHGITSVDPATGEVLWEHAEPLEQRCVGSAAINESGVLFMSAGSGGSGRESVALQIPTGDAKTKPEVLFRLRRSLPYVPSTIARGERLYMLSDGGIASCVNLKTGATLWTERIGGRFFGSPVLSDGKLHAMSMGGELVAWRAGDEFEIILRMDLGEGSQATPAVARGMMFLRTHTKLMAFDGEE